MSESENKIRTKLGEREIEGAKRQRETCRDRETISKTNLDRDKDIELDIELNG